MAILPHLLVKNFRSYTRSEIIVYLLLPMLMLHLVWIRSDHNKENMAHCEKRLSRRIGNITNLNTLYNSVNRVGQVGPEKTIFLYTNSRKIRDVLQRSLKRILKIKTVIFSENQNELTKKLVRKNYLCGITWLLLNNNDQISIKFPSVLRSNLTQLWETENKETDFEDPTYRIEGFLQVLFVLITVLRKKIDILKSSNYQSYPLALITKSPVEMRNEPFLINEKDLEKIEDLAEDPIRKERSDVLKIYFCTLYFYPLVRLVMHMSRERRTQLKELMRISNAQTCTQYLSWFISTVIVMFLIALGATFILKAPLLENGNVIDCSSFSALLLFLWIWSFAGICFSMFINALIHNNYLAVTVLLTFSISCYAAHIYLEVRNTFKRILYPIFFQLVLLDGLEKILALEDQRLGLAWEHYEEFAQDEGKFDFGAKLISFIVSGFVCLLLCSFLELVYPGKYGISKFNKSGSRSHTKAGHMNNGRSNAAVIQTIDLTKHLKSKSVNNFSMNMYDDQITVLLGLSDSGKSAIVNATAGAIPFNSGIIKIEGRDLSRIPSNKRKMFGLCPQHDALFDGLTAAQHFTFYSNLRGVDRKSMINSMKMYFKALQINKVRNVKARNLSSEDKRCLAAACSFCGYPTIVLLDEPSERMSIARRTLLWNLLRRERLCRTILVTTYHLDEADFLGDRVAIVCDGDLLFNGTSLFLKYNYGSGYLLACFKPEVFNEPLINSLVLKHIPRARISADVPGVMSYNIPVASIDTIVYLLKELEPAARQLGIDSIGIGSTSLIDKYLNATTLDSSCPLERCKICSPDETILEDGALCCNQWKAMILKKMYNIKHNKWLFASIILFPLIFFLSTPHKFTHVAEPLAYWEKSLRSLIQQPPLTLWTYNTDCKVAFVTETTQEEKLYSYLKQNSHCQVDFITKDFLKNNRQKLNEEYIFALHIVMCSYSMYTSSKYKHSEAVAAGYVAAIAQRQQLEYLCNSKDFDDLPNHEKDLLNKVRLTIKNEPYKAHQYGNYSSYLEVVCYERGTLYLTLLCLTILSCYFAAYIIKERVIGFKLLQQVQGLNIWIYWLSHLLMDWLWLSLLSVILLLIMYLEEPDVKEFLAYLVMFLLFNLALLAFLYLIMYMFTKTISACVIPILLLIILSIPYEFAYKDYPFGILYFFPHYTAIAGLHAICIHEGYKIVCRDQKSYNLIGCETHPKETCFRSGFPFMLILAGLAVLYFLLLILSESKPIFGGKKYKKLSVDLRMTECHSDLQGEPPYYCTYNIYNNFIANKIKNFNSQKTTIHLQKLSIA